MSHHDMVRAAVGRMYTIRDSVLERAAISQLGAQLNQCLPLALHFPTL